MSGRLREANLGARTKRAILEDLDYLIKRVTKVRQGDEKFLDARLRPVSEAVYALNAARRSLDAGLIESSE
jgi:hypothetical protein